MAAAAGGGRLLRRLGPLARRQSPEVHLQDPAGEAVPRPHRARGDRLGKQRLLCSGFWGLARHINYLGELGMAVGLTLALGRPLDPWPWLYPLYYVALLVPRQADDDRRCRAKYGALWDEYCRRVPHRIIPGIY
ncbi:MAG: hypothetical protein ACHQ2E_06150 [Gemmatimonadales bacterium]